MSCKVLSSGAVAERAADAWPRVGESGGGAGESSSAPDLARLEREFARREAEAREKAFREGEAAGRKAVATETQAAIRKLADTVEEISGLRASLRREAEADLVQLSLAIARRILRREISIDPEALRGIALAALEKLQSQEIARVRAHPSQAQIIASCLRERGSAVEVTADPALEPGGLLFETGRGDLDASVESQLQEIERGLTDRLEESR